jgi:hypothetical protein
LVQGGIGKVECETIRVPETKKWMIEVDGAGHPGGCDYSPYQWEGFFPLFDDFIETVMARKGQAQKLLEDN